MARKKKNEQPIFQSKHPEISLQAKDKELHRPGIYAIVNIKNGNTYIGQTVDLFDRRRTHFHDLEAGCHSNAHLQNAYNFYTKVNFKFIVLEFVDNRIFLNEREQYWINNTKSAYNIIKDVEAGISIFKFSVSDEHPDGVYSKPGETFERPNWHKWVYGGSKNPHA